MGKPMVSPLAASPAAWPVTPSSRKMKFSLERKNKTRKIPYGARQELWRAVTPSSRKNRISLEQKTTEAGGFEPPMALRPFRFSKPVHSTSYATPPKLYSVGQRFELWVDLRPQRFSRPPH